ncbi:carbohydrate-binding module family 13 [Cryphonectria parasitica EP155]|uniref:Alpha-galactosidase n=1 Tax=Cryphonectria parasitica (strain ATCC 38755 / EP155) TaxID=660469 RepID=A0A9P4Y023_CRYP1|nr:carbohydrate-binding module family 13 [Cryphonectria parasitica EP155]KAF3763915.1 carbohydrate-binding module family 13 [Cryphonectria parasitica EP155]
MGFNDWSRYMGALNESLFVQTAEAMASNGLLAAGYNRINLDDEWSLMTRAANGSMQWDPVKFPHGLPWLTAFLRERGFLPGIYTDAGNLSCGGYPGAYGHEALDAATFVGWGFEYLKLDGCNMPDATEEGYRAVYGLWHDVLSAMWPNQMVFSQSAPAYFAEAANLTDWYTVMTWVPQFGQLARHSRDTLVWNSTSYWPNITGWDSVLFNYGQEVRLARFQRPGYVNDPDFLNVDHFDYTDDERRSHFALWCSLSAPLILSTDVLNMTEVELDYLTNRDLIAVDQDPLVQQATLVSQDGTWDVLTKSLYNGDRLVTVLNRGNSSADLTVSWARIGIFPEDLATPESVIVKDLWTGENSTVSVNDETGITASSVPSHGTGVYRLSNPSPGDAIRTYPTGMIFNTYSLNCLTDSTSGTVRWTNCTAADAQVWRVRPDGHVNSLLQPDACLTGGNNGSVVSDGAGCDVGSANQWDHFISGNLINAGSGLCLTEDQSEDGSDDSVAFVEACGYLTNEQVVALPVGVAV